MKKILTLIIVASLFSCHKSKSDKSDSPEDLSKYVVRKADPGTSTTDTTKTTPKQATTTAKDTTRAATAAPTQTANSGSWDYSEEVDKMSSAKNYYAVINATELLNFDAPYDGGSTATLTIRNKAKANEVILSISKGQFASSDLAVKVRFDATPAASYQASEPSDGSTDVIFIENSAKFLKKLKTAQKLIIEAEFFESGLKTMEFNVKGFKWEH